MIDNSQKLSAGLVSVCVPTYNGAEYLKETLVCIEAQDYERIEVIISDDQSSDETLAIARAFAKNSRFSVIIDEHIPSGIGANWNNSIRLATGEFIKFLFQDDLMGPDCVSKMVSAMSTYPDCAMVACKRTYLYSTQNQELIRRMSRYEDLQLGFPRDEHGNQVLTNTLFSSPDFLSSPYNKVGEPSVTLFRKRLIDEFGEYNEDLDQVLDYEFCYRVLKHQSIVVLAEKLVSFRVHDTQASQINQQKKTKDYQRWEQMLYDEYRSLLHPALRAKLYERFHPWPEFKRKVKAKLRRS